ncbi:MAG: AAA family ATPase [Flavobacteriaceae bacterium]|nr:AAA family ATPase [Flavobacteriaceae bacterium]
MLAMLNSKKWKIFKLLSALLIVLSIPFALSLGLVFGYSGLSVWKDPVAMAWSVVGVCWATLGVVNGLLDLSVKLDIKKQNKLATPLEQSKFINRTDEIIKIAEAISENSISVHGQKGVGKSELLKFIARLCNEKKFAKDRIGSKNAKTLASFKPVYVDLSDYSTPTELLEQINASISGEKQSNKVVWKILDDYFGSTPALIILDNVNIEAAIKECLKIYQSNMNYRPADRFIFSSIEPIVDVRTKLTEIDIYPFNPSHCREMALTLNNNISVEEAEKIFVKSGGLPIYISFLSHYRELKGLHHQSFSSYFIEEVYDKLTSDEKEQVLMISLLNLGITSLSLQDYIDSQTNDFAWDVRRLNKYSMFIWHNVFSNQFFKIHDLVRDIVLEHEKKKIPLYAKKVRRFVLNQGSKAELIYALLQKSSSDDQEILSILEKLKGLQDDAAYPLIMGMWELIEQYSSPESLVNSSSEIKENFLYLYMVALLGTGDYKAAERLTGSNLFQSILPDRQMLNANKLTFQIRYSLADMDHLLNRYSYARESIRLLKDECNGLGWNEESSMCEWLDCHLSGHIGDLNNELPALYDVAANSAVSSGNRVLELRCIHGRNSILFTLSGCKHFTEDELLALVEEAHSIGANKAIISALYRNIARYYRLSFEFDNAESALKKSLKYALECGARTYINCEFSKAENLRFQGKFKDSVLSYDVVIEETKHNHDKNLMTSAMFGKIICNIYQEFSSGLPSLDNHEDDIIYIEKIAERYDMHVTLIRCAVLRFFFNHINNEHSEYDSLINNLEKYALERDIQIAKNIRKELQFIEIHVH